MKMKTYDEWRLLGYHVMKGEKSTQRNPKGEPVFTRDQVEDATEYFMRGRDEE